MVRIAMVSDFFYPNVGGVENHIYMLSVNLMRRGHKVIVITHSHPPSRVGVRWLAPALKVYHLPFVTIASSATLPNFLTFLPYFRNIVMRERIELVHGHGSLSSLAHEAILHAHLMGVRTCFTDHSLFGFDDAASILTNKLLVGALLNVDAAICVSYTGRENTVLRSKMQPHKVYVIPNAIIADRFRPRATPLPTGTINIIVISRLAYRKGIDLLVAAAPKICKLFPQVRFIIGGSGPKLIDLLQMRERYLLEDRVQLLGPISHGDVHETLLRGSIFLNTSLTESFGIAILEAACAGLHVVSTRVGGVPEVLPPDMITFTAPTVDDVVQAVSRAVEITAAGTFDPQHAHARIRDLYTWESVTERTEVVYSDIRSTDPIDRFVRMQRMLRLGPVFGLIHITIFAVACLFFMFLEWMYPRDEIHYVDHDVDLKRFEELTEQESKNE